VLKQLHACLEGMHGDSLKLGELPAGEPTKLMDDSSYKQAHGNLGKYISENNRCVPGVVQPAALAAFCTAHPLACWLQVCGAGPTSQQLHRHLQQRGVVGHLGPAEAGALHEGSLAGVS
jgi:hypothetical protein